MNRNTFATEFVGLMREAESISQQVNMSGPSTIVGWGLRGVEERFKEWEGKARRLAQAFGAESVSITAGVPFGLSLTVQFRVAKQGASALAKVPKYE